MLKKTVRFLFLSESMKSGSNHKDSITKSLTFATFCCLFVIVGVSVFSYGQERDFVAELNEPTLDVSEDNVSYKIYFEAYQMIDSAHDGCAAALSRLRTDNANYEQALEWAGGKGQQTAVDLILKKDDHGFNATQRELFGLPYGAENIPVGMDDYEFAVYIDKGQLRMVDFAYLPRYEELIALFNAEMHRAAKAGDTSRSAQCAIAMIRMVRQLCDREYYEEKVRAFDLLVECSIRLRELMWIYRESFTVEDLRTITQELEWLDLPRIKFPIAEGLIVEQLIEQIFGDDNWPDKEKLPVIMSHYESQDQPLERFETAIKWQTLAEEHATRIETVNALHDAIGNWELRWKLPVHDPMLNQYNDEFDDLDPVKYAVIRMSLSKLDSLFDQRVPFYTQINGTACAAGVLAFMIKENGKLVPGKLADPATIPLTLAQIQPSFVGAERMLVDMYDPDEIKLHYTSVKKRDFRVVTQGYDIQTPNGIVFIPEHWPLLWSIGPDKSDGDAKIYSPDGSDSNGDLIFWPVIDLMPTK